MANQKLRDEVETLKRLLAAERNARVDAEVKAASAEAKAINAVAAATRASAEAARAFADVSSAEALIAHLKLAIEKLRRELYGSSSERGRKLAGSQMLDQMELTLEELEATAAEDEIAAEMAAAKTDSEAAASRIRRKPVRKPFPAHLPRERVIVPGPSACACCGSTKLSKLGEDITETLEVIPKQWKVIQHVREKFTCRACEKISQAQSRNGVETPTRLFMFCRAVSQGRVCWP